MNWSDILILSHFVLTLTVALRVIYARRSGSAALAWLALLFAFPIFGVLLYLLIGEPRLGRGRAVRQAELLAFHDAFADRYAAANHRAGGKTLRPAGPSGAHQ